MAQSFNVRKSAALFAAISATISATFAQAIEVHLDFSGSSSLLHGSWVDGGYGDGGPLSWTASDFLSTQHSVKAKMEAIFSPFTVTFSTFDDVPTGPHATLGFGATGGDPGLLGLSSTLDWRNTSVTDGAVIYSGKFGGTFMAGTTVDHKVRDLDRLSTALANIAAHELGHTLGLQHYDAYGLPAFMAPGYAGISGQQNGSIMSSGPSGATIMGLGDALKTWSKLSFNKLEYADGVVDTVGKTISEAAGAKSTLATAQYVTLDLLSESGTPAVNIEGETGEAGQLDFYRFDAVLGNLITLNTFSDLILGDTTNTTLGLFDASGALLATNGDISYSGNSFMTGAGVYSTDSLILNFSATYTGSYYAGVLGSGSSGDYNLLITGAVPEPTILYAAGVGSLLWLKRRKASRG